MNAQLLASTVILLTTGTIVFMDWVPTPLNRNIAGMSVRERLPSTLIHGTLALVFVTMNAFSLRWGVFVGALWFSIVLYQAIVNWWVAYLFGIHRGEITPELYARHYAANVRVLPRIGSRPVVPDLQHLLIHLAVLASVLASWISFVTLS